MPSGSHLSPQGVNQGTLIDKTLPTPGDIFMPAVRLTYIFPPLHLEQKYVHNPGGYYLPELPSEAGREVREGFTKHVLFELFVLNLEG